MVQELELLFHGSRLLPRGEHGVEIHDIRARPRALRDAPKLGHAVHLAQVHARGNGRETLVQGGSGKGIPEQRRNHGVCLAEHDVEAGRGQQEGVLPQARRRIEDARRRLPFYPRDLYEQLARQPIGPDTRQHRGKIGTQLHAVPS